MEKVSKNKQKQPLSTNKPTTIQQDTTNQKTEIGHKHKDKRPNNQAKAIQAQAKIGRAWDTTTSKGGFFMTTKFFDQMVGQFKKAQRERSFTSSIKQPRRSIRKGGRREER
ncbi:hypothetical protein FCV25MIE_18234 [Fagus crenata]